MLNFHGLYLNLNTALCLYFDLEYRRFAHHIAMVPTNATVNGEEDIK